MKIEFKSTISPKKTLSTLSVLFVLSAVACSFLGDFLLPVCIGLLAVIYTFEKNSASKVGPGLTAGLIAYNVVVIILGLTPSLFGIQAVILAWMLSRAFSRQGSKADNAYLMTVVCSIFTLGSFILLAMFDTNNFTMDAVVAYYSEIGEILRELIQKGISQVDPAIIQSSGLALNAENVNTLINYLFSMIIAYVFIASFIMVGISMKLFGALSSKYAEDKTPFEKWRFNPTPIFAYFYLILYVASIFMEGGNDATYIAVINLNAIFSFVFAYMGYKFLVEMFSRRMRPRLASLVVIVLLVLFATFALQIVSILGVFYTINSRRRMTPPPKQ